MSQSKSAQAAGCFICKRADDNELLYGKFYSKWRIRVHYYCLLLTSNLVQNGETDEEGIFGFLQDDIRKEEARIQNQKCYLCKERYANISCCAKKCFRTFHTVCGIQHGCLSHFVDTFQSWCDKHVELKDRTQHAESDVCGICYDELGPYSKVESIRAPCCLNGWFHRRCVAQFAQSAGYFFKCPLCNNKDDFAREMQLRGVFVPEKDAAWELEPNAFGEQLERPSECDAEECLCRFGRDYDNSKWDLRLCVTCGSTCRHDLCMEVPTKDYVCTFCRPIVGEEAPAAVLALAEASRREEEARLAANRRGYESGIHSPGSSSGSSSSSADDRLVGSHHAKHRRRLESSDSTSSDSSESVVSAAVKRNKRRLHSTDSSEGSPVVQKKRKSIQQRNANVSEYSDSGSEVGFKRKKSKKISSSSSHSSLSSVGSSKISLQDVVKKSKLPKDSVEKLLKSRLVVKVTKLTDEQIKDLTSSENEDASSTASSTLFDFNYRVKLNKKQRRKSIADLRSIKEVIRSDTETLTDASGGTEIARAKTPSNKSFSKQFKLKLLISKSTSRKRLVSRSESDPELPPKKSCPPLDQPSSKSRVSLFPSNDEENTCPNSPRKSSVQPIIENRPSPIKSQALASLNSPVPVNVPAVKSSDSSAGSATENSSKPANHQMTLNSFFKKSPASTETDGPTSSSGSAISSSTGGSASRSAKKHSNNKTPASVRKKLVELDRSQRNLLDYFNRC